MDRSFEQANDESRARLARLVETLTPAQLAVDLGEGWTVASALAHMGFWDRWQAERWMEMLGGRWSAQDESVLASEHLANEALHPYWAGAVAEGIPALALDAATRLDALIAGAPDAVVGGLEGTPSAYLLHRHRHRREHLDHIARALRAAGLANAEAVASPVAHPAGPGADRSYIARNRASLDGLKSLLATLTPADLASASGEGDWTVGQVLGHLAFWDRFLAGRWRTALVGGPGAQPGALPQDVTDMLNAGLAPTWAAYGTGAAQAVIADAIRAAESINGLIADLPEETPTAAILESRPSLLDRSIHRAEHIATIELALARGRS